MLYKLLTQTLTVSNGLIAGTFFIFSTVIMASLARTDPANAARTMQAINVVIVRSPFLVFFLLSAILSLVMPIYAWVGGDRQHAVPQLIAGATYFIGVFLVTMTINVPMNNKLDAATGPGLVTYWSEYLTSWTAWNHVRTIASTLATAILVFAK